MSSEYVQQQFLTGKTLRQKPERKVIPSTKPKLTKPLTLTLHSLQAIDQILIMLQFYATDIILPFFFIIIII